MRKKKIWISYWKTQKQGRIMVYLCLAVFIITFFLYQLPMEGSLYGGFICLCLAGALEVRNFLRYKNRCEEIGRMKEEVSYGIQEFPETEYELELRYQNVIRFLIEDKRLQDLAKEKKYKEMTEYYTTWVHQIKTPIAAMRLLLKEDTEQNREVLMELFKIEQYVDMVLQYVRLEAKGSDYQIRQYDLDAIVRQSIRKYARLFISKKIALEYKGTDIKVVTDEKWLSFVVDQILSNALKYTKKGKIQIYLLNEKKKELVIEDTGIGIAAQDLPRVFESSFTGYNGREDKRATGIGLYLCKRIMGQLSHTIRIESELGKGTRVILGLDTISLEYE